MNRILRRAMTIAACSVIAITVVGSAIVRGHARQDYVRSTYYSGPREVTVKTGEGILLSMLQAPFELSLQNVDANVLGAGFTHAASQQKPEKGGYVIEHDTAVATRQPGPHNGGGETIGHSFFSDVPNLSLVFRKRILKAGSGIGYHTQTQDEIYYVLSGQGVMTLDGRDVNIGPGTAVLTRAGSSHGLKHAGSEDLVIMINYLAPTK